jgi:DNA mismatch repair protein MutS2
MGAALDLLHHEPRPRADQAVLRDLLAIAFETGDSGASERAIDGAPATQTSWDPQSFAGHVFLSELCRGCFPIQVPGVSQAPRVERLEVVFGRPPSDLRDVKLRQAVLAALAEDEHARRGVEDIYRAAQKLRGLLEASGFGAATLVRRKLDILSSLKDTIDAMAERFGDDDTALARMCHFAQRTQASDAYARLRELLDYEGHLATLDVRLRLCYDGRIRDMELLAVRENPDNRFVPKPIRRFFSKLWRFFRGYRFGEDEVLIRFVDDVFFGLRDAVMECLELIGHLEPYLACLGLRSRAESAGLNVCLAELVEAPADGEERRELRRLFNPLLLRQRVQPEPTDLVHDRHDSLLILTGPNSGGKTRLLQAVAIAQLLGQGGFFAPATSARLVRAKTLFVSLVDEAEVDQSEGRLGTELRRIRTVFEQLHEGSLVVLDELCSGTNPAEGQALFEMVVSLLPRMRPQVFLSTHYLDLARELHARPPVPHLSFLRVELDEAQRPSYRFVPGVAESSLAAQVARRLGVTREELEALIDARRGQAGTTGGAGS